GPRGRGGPATATDAPSRPAARAPPGTRTRRPPSPGRSGRLRRRCPRRCGTPPSRPASSPSIPGPGSSATEPPRVGRGVGDGVREHGEDESLRVPEGVAVVARSGQALCRDCALLGAGAGLERVEEREADRLLELGVSLELDVGGRPEVVEIGTL